MGDSPLNYKERVLALIHDSRVHLYRVTDAIQFLEQRFKFPLSPEDYETIQGDPHLIAWADQIIYRFSKAQDTVGAKLFKAFLLAQGEDTDRPFLDILNTLEKIQILSVDSWFELRDLRNEISHTYEAAQSLNILNAITEYRHILSGILDAIERTLQ